MDKKLDTSFVGHHVSSGGFIFCRVEGVDYVVLLQNSKNEYVFPKGHLENGEEMLETAKREIEEETGINATDLQVLNSVPSDRVEYKFTDKNGFENTKEVYIFTFKVSEKFPLIKEDNPGFLGVAWFDVSEAKKILSYNLESLEKSYEEYLKSL